MDSWVFFVVDLAILAVCVGVYRHMRAQNEHLKEIARNTRREEDSKVARFE